MIKNCHAEFVGGPMDGEVNHVGAHLPREIFTTALPEDHWATCIKSVEIPPATLSGHLKGTYSFRTLHWSPLYPETELGDYEWQGYR